MANLSGRKADRADNKKMIRWVDEFQTLDDYLQPLCEKFLGNKDYWGAITVAAAPDYIEQVQDGVTADIEQKIEEIQNPPH